ncbi:META domain-containing protein [Pedobacter sp. AW1-32]|uniref:META domain-containing protein n=1 Tax=Pedobacter sp. AW1-32 TaxID=3383026 RepID=UPI003FED8496
MKNLILFSFLIVLFSACSNKFSADSLQNTKWQLTKLPGLALPANGQATLNFSDSLRISGKSFCNNFGGQAEISGKNVSLKNIFGTKMFCQETDAAERAYLQAINQVNQAKIDNGKLYLMHGEQTLLVFNKLN